MRSRPSLQPDSNHVRSLYADALHPENEGGLSSSPRVRMTVEEIAHRLDLGRPAVYTMLEQGIIPAIRLGRRWIVTRHAFENWERTCGMPTGLQRKTEHKVT